MTKPPPLPSLVAPELSGSFSQVVMACLDKDPRRRPDIVRLRQVLEAPPTAAPSRRRLGLLLATLALLIAAALIFRPSPPPVAEAGPDAAAALQLVRDLNNIDQFGDVVNSFTQKEMQARKEFHAQMFKIRIGLEEEMKRRDPEFREIHSVYTAAQKRYWADESNKTLEKAYWDQIELMSYELHRRVRRQPDLSAQLKAWDDILYAREERNAAALTAVDPIKGAAYRRALEEVRARRRR